MQRAAALIFDLGNVVFRCSMSNAYAYWARASGLTSKTIAQRIDLEHTAHYDFEKGLISEDEFWEFVSSSIRSSLSRADFVTGWNSIYEDEVVGVRSILDTLARQHRLIALTNTNATHAKVWRARYADVLSRFELVIASHEIAARKPEVEAYEACIRYLAVTTDEIILFDDRAENVKAASRLGLRTVLVSSFDQMRRELRSMSLAGGF